MTFADWPSDDPHPVSLPTIVSTTDLFDGELFGDELIDIYNSSVADGTNDITLPDAKDKEIDEDHPGTKMAVTAAAIDDGLGAFRPSTSFNDLTTLLPPVTEGAEKAAPITEAEAPQAAVKPTKKRGIQHNVEVPPIKRKAVAPRGARRPSAKKSFTATPAEVKVEPKPEVVKPSDPPPRAVSSSESKTEDDTPNPLVPEAASSTTVSESRTGANDEDLESKTPTEADFKSIAQAAVSNLIMSVASTKPSEDAPSTDKASVDISTAHIKALTGNNWVAACTTNNAGAPVTAQPTGDCKSNNRVRRQNLTADERAQQNPDRNREHARNTRLRKKAYVEELKRTLTELVAQRDAAEAEKRQVAQRELEQREVRFRVTEEFMKLKGRNESNAARWAAILEDGFSLTVPHTDIYKMAEGKKSAASEMTYKGVASVMADSQNFFAFLQTLDDAKNGTTSLQFNCDRKNFFMDGCNSFLEWTASLSGSDKLLLKGVIRCSFSPASNKLISANLSFDSGMLRKHLRSKNTFQNTSDEMAAEAAANQADAILDSLQMPGLNVLVPSNVAVVPPSSASSASEGSLEKGDCDDSLGDHPADKQEDAADGMTTRQVEREAN